MAFHPYLNFGGNCREAFTRYQEIFGGELHVMGVGDMPGDEEVPDGMADMVIHAALMTGDQLLMASDDASPDFAPPNKGVYVNFTTADLDEADRVFAALAEGGEIEMPIGETFWSPKFGVCVDRFGTPWMINAEVDQT